MLSKLFGLYLLMDAIVSIFMDWQKRKYVKVAHGFRVFRGIIGFTLIMLL